MSNRKYSISLLVLAAVFYVSFDLIIPEIIYSGPQMQTEGGTQTIRAVGMILMKITPGLSLVMVALAAYLYLRERRG